MPKSVGKATGLKAAHKRSQLSRERQAITKFVADLRARLDQSEGLWRYWTTHDITENEDDWAAFSNAVYDHLAGKPVDPRFIVAAPKKG